MKINLNKNTSTKTQKILKTSLISIAIVLITAELFYLLALPLVIDYALKKNVVQKILLKETGLSLNADEFFVKTKVNFSADINIKNLKITDSEKKEVINANLVKTNISLPSLLFNAPKIKRFETNDLTLRLIVDKENNLWLGTYKIDTNKSRKLKLKSLKADIKNAKILIEDKKTQKHIHIDIPSLKIKKYVRNKYLYATIASNITSEGKVSNINLNIDTKLPLLKNANTAKLNADINNLNLSSYGAFLSKYANPQIKEITGVVNANLNTKNTGSKNILELNAVLKDFSLIMKNPSDSLGSQKELTVNFNGTADENKINLDVFKVSTQDWQIKTFGRIIKYKDSNPILDLDLEIPTSDLHPMYQLLPSLPDSNEAIQKIKKYGIWADIEGKLQVKGRVKKPLIYGPVTISDLYILKYDKRIPKCRIDLDFNGSNFNIHTKVFTRPNQFVEVKGTADNKLGGYGDFKITSSPVVDLATTLTILVPIHDVVGFDLGPLPFMKLDGIGNISIRTLGTVLDGTVDGVFNFKNTTATLDGLNTKLERANGRLDFNGKNLYFETQSAYIKGSPVKITGDADLKGNIDFKVSSPSIATNELLTIAKTSKDLKSIANVLKPVEKLDGNCSVEIQIKGLVDDFSKLMNNINLSGKLNLKNNTAESNSSPVIAKKINGIISFSNNDWNADLTVEALASKFDLSAKSYKNLLELDINTNNLKIDELLNVPSLLNLEKKDVKNLPHTNAILDLKAQYQGPADKIDYNKIKLRGFFKPISYNANYPFIIKSGDIELYKGELKINNFSSKFFNTNAKFDGKIQNVFSQKPIFNYNLNISNFDVSSFDKIKHMHFIPQYAKKILGTYENYSGRADVNIICRHNDNQGKIKLQEIKFVQKSLQIPINIDSGDILINGDLLSLKSINANFDNTPIFVNANVRKLGSDISFDGYFTTKMTDYFVNKYINNQMTFPIKPKGDITITTGFSGNTNGYQIKPVIKLDEDADIYYMGSNLGDTSEKREINGDITIKNNVYDIKKITYLRYMTSQNDHTYPLEIISAGGKILQKNNKIFLQNMKIVTKNSANVKLFNAIFRKSVLKQGMFNCNIVLNGDVNTPKILGEAKMSNLDMPLYDTIIKDIQINFGEKLVNLKVNGMSFDSDFLIESIIRNSITLPVVIESLKISSGHVNLDSIIDSLTKVTLSNVGMTPTAGKLTDPKTPLGASDFIVHKGEMEASNIIIRGIPAANYRANFSLGRDSILKVSGIDFEITGGKVSGLATYNFNNAKITAEMNAKNVDANQMASSFFEVKDQIFGSLNGNAVITTYGNSDEERLKNMAGSVYFAINDGKMPKLGSLEYLLKASNLIKSGITGLSINNFLDIVAPVKTGYFDVIRGLIILKNGGAQNLEIYSSGENLNLYIKGKYDFPEQNADLKVFGRLTKKADNLLGPIGNASFNSILNLIPGFRLDKADKAKIIQDLNKIPGVEFNDQAYRIFFAKIDGDVNGEKYVQYFKWIE